MYQSQFIHKLIVLSLLFVLAVPLAAQDIPDTASDLVEQVQMILSEEAPDLDRALELANQAVELDPEFAPAYNWRAEVLWQLDELDRALADYEMAVALDSTYAEAIKNVGVWHYYVAQDVDEARRYYEQAIEADPAYMPAYVEIGLIHYRDADYQVTVDTLTTAIEGDITGNYAITAYNVRGIANSQLGNIAASIDDYTAAIELAPDDPVLYSNRAYQYGRNQQYEMAVADYDRAIELAPDNEFDHYYRASMKLQLDDTAGALEDYDTAIAINPEYVNALWGRARLYEKSYDYELAIADYDAAIAVNDTAAVLFAGRGRVYRYMGVYDKAIADYSAAIALEPDNVDYYVARANLYKTSSDNASAYMDLTSAIELDPDNQSHYFARVPVGTPSQQVETYSLLLERFDPDNQSWILGRAQANILAGEPDAAFADFDRMEELGAESYYVYELRGDAYAELGMWEEAIASFSQTIERNPNFSERVQLDLAEMYLQTGDLDAAESAIRQYRDQNMGITFGRDIALEGILLVQRGNLDQAETIINELRSNTSGYVFPLQAEASLQMARGNYEQALVLLDEAMSIQDDDEFGNVRVDTIIQMMRAETHFNLDNRDAAIMDYDAVLAKSADFIPALIGKAQVFIELDDDPVSAQPLLEHILEIDPDNEEAQALLD